MFFLKIFFLKRALSHFFSSSLLMWFSPNSYFFLLIGFGLFLFFSFLKFFKKTRGTWEDFKSEMILIFFSKIIKLIFWVVVVLIFTNNSFDD